MNAVRLSDRALGGDAAQVERELVQIATLNSQRTEAEKLSLDATSPAGVRGLAVSRGLDLSSEATTPLAELWGEPPTVTVIVACYNYGHYLDEAVASVLAQSYMPDQIILSDDASTDGSPETMRAYAERYPGVIELNLNAQNQGIQKHFNGVMEQATGDLVLFLGADNRMPANYVESLFSALAADQEAGIAYTDFALFGGRAKNDYDRLLPQFQGTKLPNGVYCSSFPEYTTESKQLLDEGHNFIHGSSMYRRSAFTKVGGYGSRDDGPEDMGFFHAVLALGYSAKKVSETVLEYRQHSVEQANYQFSYFGELQRLHEEGTTQKGRIAQLQDQVRELSDENAHLARSVQQLRSSRSFRLGSALLSPVKKLLNRNPRH